MTILTVTYVTEAPNTLIRSARWNTNFSDITSFINSKLLDSTDNIRDGGIANASIVASAGINYSKLTLTNSIVNADVNSSAAILASKLDLTAPNAIGTATPAAGKFTTLEATSTFKLGTTNQGDILYDNGTSLVRLTPGTSGQFLKSQGASANPVWATASTTIQTFLSTGSFTPPSGVTKAYVTIAGAGGGGGGGSGGGGGGGGAGAVIIKHLMHVSSATTYTVTVGAAGTGGAGGPSDPGTNGGNSSFAGTTSPSNYTVTANGGTGGTGGTGGGGGGGGSGASGNTTLNGSGKTQSAAYSYAGGNGGSKSGVESGAGGSSYLAIGAPGSNGSTTPSDAPLSAGGGGGGGTGSNNGGNGGKGFVIIEYGIES